VSIQELDELRRLENELQSGLDFYSKFVGTANPKHKGIPYMAAADTFSTSTLHAYGKFWRLFKQVCQKSGLTSTWDKATGYGGWIYHHRRAMGILFPRAPGITKIVDGYPTIVPDKTVKDPERASKALPHLQKMLDLINRELINIEGTLTDDPQFASVEEAVIRRLFKL